MTGWGPCSLAEAAAPRTLGDSMQLVLRRRVARGALAIPLGDILRLVFHNAVTYDKEAW